MQGMGSGTRKSSAIKQTKKHFVYYSINLTENRNAHKNYYDPMGVAIQI
jgi:hypothetical protein